MRRYKKVLQDQQKRSNLLKELVDSVVPKPNIKEKEQKTFTLVMNDCELHMGRGPGNDWWVDGKWSGDDSEMSSMDLYRKAEWLMEEEE